MRKFKTAADNRTNYIYYFNDGSKCVITPGEDGENTTIIAQLHAMDDEQVDADRREDYHCPVHYQAYSDGEGEDADDRNPYLCDTDADPLEQMLASIRQQEHSDKLDRLKAALSDEQATSYEAQVEHYTDYIRKNPEWEFAGIFADDGISGTNTKKREEFNRMIDEAMAGKIDMIVTKSISRFARNTLDCLKYIRQLKEKNIPVYFEKENINTMDAKGEVLLTIMASLAQQESQSLSQNVKLGFQYRYQQGQITVNHNRFLGYTKDEKGQLIIEPDEAEMVKRIFREYLEGASL